MKKNMCLTHQSRDRLRGSRVRDAEKAKYEGENRTIEMHDDDDEYSRKRELRCTVMFRD